MPRGREQELALNRYLDAESIFVSVRYTSGIGGVRVSPHYFTDLDEIDNFFVELDWFLTKGSPMV
jgi:selenocysteine lyase/cysteine desulfurase